MASVAKTYHPLVASPACPPDSLEWGKPPHVETFQTNPPYPGSPMVTTRIHFIYLLTYLFFLTLEATTAGMGKVIEATYGQLHCLIQSTKHLHYQESCNSFCMNLTFHWNQFIKMYCLQFLLFSHSILLYLYIYYLWLKLTILSAVVDICVYF